MKTLAVVIATYNRFELLKQTLETLFKNTDSDFEVVVVDDASNDNLTRDYLSKRSDIFYYRFAKRVSIAQVRNMGEFLASGSKYIHFSDNDVYYKPHWDTRLIDVLESFPHIGIVGGKKHPQHTILRTASHRNYQILEMNNQPGYSLFLRREDFKKFGPFKPYPLGQYGAEDSLFVENAINKGYVIAAVEPSVLYHCGLNSSENKPTADYYEMMNIKIGRPDILFL